ncbi:MAG: hypothetical protein V3R82_03485 [Candidatus Hydrothermarchaeales archaeon]
MIENLTVYEKMLEIAKEDSRITQDEYLLLEKIREHYGIYTDSLKKAIKDGMIGEEEAKNLKKIRIEMYEDVLKSALEDAMITDEEQKILDALKESLELDDYTLAMIEIAVRGK